MAKEFPPNLRKEANARKRALAERRYAEVARRFLEGQKIQEIADAMGLHRATIGRMLGNVRAEWRKEGADSYRDYVPERLRQIEHLYQEAWKAWRKSWKSSQSKTTSTGKETTTTKTTAKSFGNPAYLAEMRQLLRLDSEIRGLLDKDKTQTSTDEVGFVEIVVTSREEAEEVKTLSMDDFRKQRSAG